MEGREWRNKDRHACHNWDQTQRNKYLKKKKKKKVQPVWRCNLYEGWGATALCDPFRGHVSRVVRLRRVGEGPEAWAPVLNLFFQVMKLSLLKLNSSAEFRTHLSVQNSLPFLVLQLLTSKKRGNWARAGPWGALLGTEAFLFSPFLFCRKKGSSSQTFPELQNVNSNSYQLEMKGCRNKGNVVMQQ